MKIPVLVDASFSNGLQRLFHPSFQLTPYDSVRQLRQQLRYHEVLLCRSSLRVNKSLLKDSMIRCVATASSGTDHVDSAYLTQHAITLLDARGANARSVTDYVIACLAYLQHHHGWQGSQVGIIGVGAVGRHVQGRLQALGYTVHGYDPLRAKREPGFTSAPLEAVIQSDILCIHANLHDGPDYPSRHILNAALLADLRPGTVILNAARGEIVDESALLSSDKTLYYCTDVYANEPMISPAIVAYATLCTPHIAGHSIEARRATLTTVVKKLHQQYGLKMPQLATDNELPQETFSETDSWQETVLALYNPGAETRVLKEAEHLSETFLTLRLGHRMRHNFDTVFLPLPNSELQSALGL